MLDGCTGFAQMRINSSTIKSLAFALWDEYYEEPEVELRQVVIKDAPLLQMLVPFRHWTRNRQIELRVVNAPKLRVLGSLSIMISQLELGGPVFNASRRYVNRVTSDNVSREKRLLMDAIKLSTKLQTVKILALEDVDRINVVTNFLMCFPRLEKLYISSRQALPHFIEQVEDVVPCAPSEPGPHGEQENKNRGRDREGGGWRKRAHLVVDGQEGIGQEGSGEEEEGAALNREKAKAIEEGESLAVMVGEFEEGEDTDARVVDEEGAQGGNARGRTRGAHMATIEALGDEGGGQRWRFLGTRRGPDATALEDEDEGRSGGGWGRTRGPAR
ncbi:hypothetical protein PR202_ga30531 [Eleusine coracana subsp. coracana]|uniref:F-box/LRR-repeat protein 15/At3g58940/PEG3-like LRR domain-containing protein n=1 Tax=Eleusine coracana subsp. coracana TaxID=191504 RepID=A0AAV5DQ28_ELECO|nr:hypothetical protein PR202_ga30497 [Eleusine coracana subsp. coracana]GJN12267.1 hypothetical protein PR202_ga30531 [Eleusine coracana subsp. coracana]